MPVALTDAHRQSCLVMNDSTVSCTITDALGGQIDVGVATLTSVLPMINSGKVRALAVSGRTRSPVLPNVSTVGEAGVPGYEADKLVRRLRPARNRPYSRQAAVHPDSEVRCRAALPPAAGRRRARA
jgi:hypothetical protein